MKRFNTDDLIVHVNKNQLKGIQAGLAEIMQGCMTLNKVLTMIQIPESSKYPEGRPELSVPKEREEQKNDPAL